MNFSNYIRRPFMVEAIQITEENITEISAMLGEYISTKRRLVPNVNRANIGWYLTRMDGNYRCYSPKVFEEQFLLQDPDLSGVAFVFDEESEQVETDQAHPLGISRPVIPLDIVD